MSRPAPKGYSLLDIPVGKYPSRYMAKVNFQQTDYTSILQDYLDELTREDYARQEFKNVLPQRD